MVSKFTPLMFNRTIVMGINWCELRPCMRRSSNINHGLTPTYLVRTLMLVALRLYVPRRRLILAVFWSSLSLPILQHGNISFTTTSYDNFWALWLKLAKVMIVKVTIWRQNYAWLRAMISISLKTFLWCSIGWIQMRSA